MVVVGTIRSLVFRTDGGLIEEYEVGLGCVACCVGCVSMSTEIEVWDEKRTGANKIRGCNYNLGFLSF